MRQLKRRKLKKRKDEFGRNLLICFSPYHFMFSFVSTTTTTTTTTITFITQATKTLIIINKER